MARVRIENGEKSFGSVNVIRNVNIVAEDGEFVVLVGPSGCGKSTLLRTIAGLEEISSGRIKIGERVVNNLNPRDRDIAMVFQNYALYPYKTARENMEFSLVLLGFAKIRARSSGQPGGFHTWRHRTSRPTTGPAFRRSKTARRHGARDRA